MSVLSIIGIDEEKKWDKIVKGFKGYDIEYLSGYAKAFQTRGDGEPILIYYNDGSTKAINVVMKRDIALSESFKGKLPVGCWFDLSTPYGYGGFWIEGNNFEAVEDAYNSYCKAEGFISEFVRFNLFSKYQTFFKGDIESHSHNIVRSLDLSLEDILIDFEHKIRKSLKKANKAGLKIEIDCTGKRLDEFLEVYYQTMKRTHADNEFFFTKNFFETLNKMKDNYVYIHALYEDKIVSTELILYGEESCYSFLGGTNQEYFDLRPNDFLKYEVIKWAKDKGLKKFILGGGHGSDDGLFKYKKYLAPNGVYDFYIGKKIFNEEKYKELLKMRKEISNFNEMTSFFPEYRY